MWYSYLREYVFNDYRPFMHMLGSGLFLSLLFICCNLNLQGQSDEKESDEIQYVNEVYYYPGVGKEMTELERGEVKIKSKVKIIGMGNPETVYTMPGERSQQRFSNDNLRFAVKLSDMMDPSMFIQLYSFKPAKGQREALIQSQGIRGKGKDDDSNIAIRIQESGAGTYIMVPAKTLPPGEYGFINMMAPRQSGFGSAYPVFAFGIDQ